jgi:hypothetical protein
MEAAHRNQQQAQESLEIAFELLCRTEGHHFTPETAKRWAEVTRPLVPAIRGMMTGIAEDLRPLVPPGKQPRFAGDMLLLGLAFDAYEKKMDRWAEGNVREREDPFDPDEEMRERQKAAGINANQEALQDARRTAEEMLKHDSARQWAQMVEQAGKYYGFDEAQKKTAESILQELRDRAEQVMTEEWKGKMLLNRTKVYLSYQLRLQLWNTPWEWKLEAEHEELSKPMGQLTRELQDRLNKVARDEQREAAASRIAAKFGEADLRE